MKTPITYYGGKQKLLPVILPLFPQHKTFTEPFIGGGAVFWAKARSDVEVVNDNNREIINFYQVTQSNFTKLEKMISATLHSRSLYNDAYVIYNNPHMFSNLQRAWAVWALAAQSFSSKFGGGWGYDVSTKKSARLISNKRDSFLPEYSERLRYVQIECTDALRIIRIRDTLETFHYYDPPYFNADCGHYDKYDINDFEALLNTLENIKGKFLLSSYASDMLSSYSKRNQWFTKKLEQKVSVPTGVGSSSKRKIELLTANYDISCTGGLLLNF